MATDGSSRQQSRRLFSRDDRRSEAFQHVSGLLGCKWHIGILYHLSRSDGMRFSQLQERIDGVSGKMLSESLERLETRYGVVERTILEDKPLRVEYSLTERGESLEPTVVSIAEWTGRNQVVVDEWEDERD